MVQAMNLVEDGLHLQSVVLDSANHAASGVESVIVRYFRSEEVVDALARWAIHQIVGRVFVRPRGSAVRRLYDFKNRIRVNRIVGKFGSALTLFVDVAGQSAWIDHIQRDRRIARVFVDSLVEYLHIPRLSLAGGIGRIKHTAVEAHIVEQSVTERGAGRLPRLASRGKNLKETACEHSNMSRRDWREQRAQNPDARRCSWKHPARADRPR